MLKKLEKAFQQEKVVDITGNQLSFKNVPMNVSRQGKLEYVIKFMEEHKDLTPEEMQEEIHLKYSPYIKENTKWDLLVNDGRYVGSYDETFVKDKPGKDGLIYIRVFVPYFGYITVASCSKKYDSNKYGEAILKLFMKTGVLFSPELSHVNYTPKENHQFVKPVNLQEFVGVCSFFDVSMDAIDLNKGLNKSIAELRMKLNTQETHNYSLELELEKKKKCITSLNRKNKDLEKAIDDLTAPKLKEIEKERNNHRNVGVVKNQRKYHYLHPAHAKKLGKKPGFYYANKRREDGSWEYSKSGYRTSDPEQFFTLFNYVNQGYTAKEIYNKMPYFRKRYTNSSGVNNIIQQYKKGLFYHAIRGVIEVHNLPRDYLKLREFKPIPILV